MDSIGYAEGRGHGRWTEVEHESFLQGLKLYPQGPWRAIANYIGTRSVKQVQTHAQKYQQKVERRNRGLRKNKKNDTYAEHRVDETTSGHIETIVRLKASRSDSPRSPFTRQTSLEESTLDDVDLASLVERTDPVPFIPGQHSQEYALDDGEIEELLETLHWLLAYPDAVETAGI
ncbi:hypothetical protein Poli38472_006541 [Pythium oligandrum]|uniref:Uncharacterized protein n=1 Tax=Pythium oligandrum TaxID=41045 RepID=A0A8K1C4Z2_PYTOL|nr:hypothetical protein Poli38472_006541 [Pythium oligandrum]|eukprot:TMW56531.1 hypothetical protein Poli38472_006541 [Pythium oligandrum]